MNVYNNFETLSHYKGSIWVTEHQSDSEEKGLNLCSLIGGDFKVLYYIIKTKNGYTFDHGKFYKDLDEIINEALSSLGLLNLLDVEPDESIITCQKCNKTFNEGNVNIVDYPIDLCVKCEEEYKKIVK
ncbi:hypothetical protein P8891_05715 [Bacillus atrophaeus]|uniref:hypothetical protein n=1 Tax=Bacillus atrophaeus TaxID=1452 RepID=UPI002281BB95|nr:hypothetical protein [Bacillus atrophaeus]MCY7947947.1 hypothetical protein [Bacillus atrophaeus]MCY8098254.1 hypothetical protein [Bacillus atrophaeus]MCY9170031.1 hypothetical protein [Bacillus atrophaeus]MEC0740584.1 hypothetical protein [Bacillus atrophaeus]MEC0746980.1 hypothetical protein [Bacillus atrophaeus]